MLRREFLSSLALGSLALGTIGSVPLVASQTDLWPESDPDPWPDATDVYVFQEFGADGNYKYAGAFFGDRLVLVGERVKAKVLGHTMVALVGGKRYHTNLEGAMKAYDLSKIDKSKVVILRVSLVEVDGVRYKIYPDKKFSWNQLGTEVDLGLLYFENHDGKGWGIGDI